MALELLDHAGALELLCYTPEKFEEKREEMGIVRVALRRRSRCRRDRAPAAP